MNSTKTPRWMVLIIFIFMLPVFQFPELLSSCPPDMEGIRNLLWIYPFYVVLTGWLAYLCYPSRRAICWILLILMLLSHLCMFLLVG